eukprot:s1238_g24.t1
MRAALQAFQLRDNLKRVNCDLRWVASDYDLADAFTKKRADSRVGLLKFLQSRHWSIAFDPNFVAAKRNERTAIQKWMTHLAIPKHLTPDGALVSVTIGVEKQRTERFDSCCGGDFESSATRPIGGILRRVVEPNSPLPAPATFTLEVTQKILPQSFAADCGVQTFTWIVAQAMGYFPTATTPEHAEHWRHLFAQHLLQHQQHLDIIHCISLGGMKDDEDLQSDLTQLLSEHGVFPERLKERAAKILAHVPQPALKSIVSSRKPWADLNQAANQAKPSIKLITQDELDAQIATRAKHRAQFGRKPVKSTFKQNDHNTETVSLKASEIQVPEGVFRQRDGKVLGPLQANQVGINAEGVVLVDEEESHAVLKLPTPVIQKGLAARALATKENARLHGNEPTRFPALCMSIQEPLIAAGYIYQLGETFNPQFANMHPTVIASIEANVEKRYGTQMLLEHKLGHVDQSVMQVQASQAGVNQMQVQMDQQCQHIAQTLDQKMTEQIDRIEALFNKRVRHEWLHDTAVTNLAASTADR